MARRDVAPDGPVGYGGILAAGGEQSAPRSPPRSRSTPPGMAPTVKIGVSPWRATGTEVTRQLSMSCGTTQADKKSAGSRAPWHRSGAFVVTYSD
jgi:hypothetical protein